MKAGEKMTYRKAVEELERILRELESEQVDIDLLAERVKRAAYLVKLCRERLRKTEQEVQKVLAEIDEEADEAQTAES